MLDLPLEAKALSSWATPQAFIKMGNMVPRRLSFALEEPLTPSEPRSKMHSRQDSSVWSQKLENGILGKWLCDTIFGFPIHVPNKWPDGSVFVCMQAEGYCFIFLIAYGKA